MNNKKETTQQVTLCLCFSFFHSLFWLIFFLTYAFVSNFIAVPLFNFDASSSSTTNVSTKEHFGQLYTYLYVHVEETLAMS